MEIYPLLEKVRREKPVVHHLTNWVTIYDCANVVKVFGASPVMAHAIEESGDMAKIAGALVLNIGTLTPEFIESMKVAAKSANQKGIPVVLDVCGAGATKLRDDKCFELLDQVKINIIKGNSSEVARIAGQNAQTKGVDATEVEANLVDLARGLADKRDCSVVITGAEDVCAGKSKHYLVKNGCAMMGSIVGTGCMAASVVGTFAAVKPDDLPWAAAAGLACYEIAAQLAAKEAAGAGTFKEKLFDHIYNLSQDQVESMQRVVEGG